MAEQDPATWVTGMHDAVGQALAGLSAEQRGAVKGVGVSGQQVSIHYGFTEHAC